MRLCFAWVFASLAVSVELTTSGVAHADLPDGGDISPPACPEADAVWSSVTRLVPSATSELLAAKPRVSMIDGGDRYRIRVTTSHGVVERTYTDVAHDCAKRTRFAAEFIVLALLPPAVPDSASSSSPDGATGTASVWASETDKEGARASGPTPASSSKGAPAKPVAPTTDEPPATVPAAPRVSAPSSPEQHVAPPTTSSSSRPGASVVRLELSAIAANAPSILNAPDITTWGADLRARFGSSVVAGVLGVSYSPEVVASVDGVHASVARFPGFAGIRVRGLTHVVEVAADAGMTVAIERYAGVSFRQNYDSTRVTPGFELGIVVSSRPAWGFAPIAGLRVEWLPLVDNLAAAPAGDVAKTPSVWLGGTLGLSFEP